MMKIRIKQQSISFGSQYKIFIGNEEKFYAETDVFSKSIINIYKPNELQPSFRTFKSLYFNYPKYKIEMPNGERIKFVSNNFWRTKYTLEKGNDIYELYRHKERKVSVFKNNIQIAFWEKEAITYLVGDYYEIMANKNSEKELLIALCLIMDNIHSKGGSLFNVDLGLIFKEKKSLIITGNPIKRLKTAVSRTCQVFGKLNFPFSRIKFYLGRENSVRFCR